MSITNKGIYFPSDYNEVADVPADMKKMAMSIDDIIENNDNKLNEIDTSINTNKESIDSLLEQLKKYSFITETGNQIELQMDNLTYKIKVILKNKNGDIIDESEEIDLPIETMVTDITYNDKILTLILKNGTIKNISIANLIDGLVTESEFNELCKKNIEIENELTELASQMPWNTTEISKSIHIEDSAKYSRNKLDLFGDLTQEKREGYNLIDTTAFTDRTVNGVAFNRNSDGSILINGTSTSSVILQIPVDFIISAGDYTIFVPYNSDTKITVSLGYDTAILETSIQPYKMSGTNTHCKNITFAEDTSINQLRFYINSNITINNYLLQWMLVKGTYTADTIPPYEQYGAMPSIKYPSMPQVVTGVQTIKLNDNVIATLDLGNTELCKIIDTKGNVLAQDRPVYRLQEDGTYKWQWEKNIYKIVFTGNESWLSTTAYEGFNRFRFDVNNENLLLDTAISVFGLNSHFTQRIYQSHGGYEYLYVQTTKTGGSIYIQLKDIKTVEDLKALLIEQYNNGSPITVYYVGLKNSYEDCTPAQSETLDKLYKLSLQKGTNNIFVESENGLTADLQLTYMQDLQSKLNQLESMIVSNASEEVTQ